MIKISLKFVPKCPINNIPALVQIMAWRRPGDKPLSETIMYNILTHIYVARPQWVKMQTLCFIPKWLIIMITLPCNYMKDYLYQRWFQQRYITQIFIQSSTINGCYPFLQNNCIIYKMLLNESQFIWLMGYCGLIANDILSHFTINCIGLNLAIINFYTRNGSFKKCLWPLNWNIGWLSNFV